MLLPNEKLNENIPGRCDGDRMEVGLATTYTISQCTDIFAQLDSRPWRGVLSTSVCAKVCEGQAGVFPPVYSGLS